MKLITNEELHKIIADEGKHIRSINDTYTEEYKDEETGKLVPEHLPYYSTLIYVPSSMTEEMMNQLYIEENITEE